MGGWDIRNKDLIEECNIKEIYYRIEIGLKDDNIEELKEIIRDCQFYDLLSKCRDKRLLKYYKVILKRYPENEDISRYILSNLINSNLLEYYDYSQIIKILLTWRSDSIINLCSILFKEKISLRANEGRITELEAKRIINLLIKAYNDDLSEKTKSNLFIALATYPFPNKCEKHLHDIIINTKNKDTFESALKSYGVLLDRNPRYLDNFIQLLKRLLLQQQDQ